MIFIHQTGNHPDTAYLPSTGNCWPFFCFLLNRLHFCRDSSHGILAMFSFVFRAPSRRVIAGGLSILRLRRPRPEAEPL